MSWLSDIVKGAAGGLVGELTGSLERAYTAKLAADTNEKKLEAERAIEFFKGQIALANEAAKNDKWWSPRTIMAYSAASYVVKIVFWDTVCGLGVTPDPGPQVTGIVLVIVGFYFGSKVVTDIAGKLLAGWAARRGG